ncbi:AEC family transporter [Microvirga sp. W0021]|uniref:AEC family transporter n=1 Tax=Hohaiivirga grylli TaxID=3133970 RepID=A0ABV0BII2_9HYPH
MQILMVILPVFSVYALGYFGYHYLKPDIAGLARLSVYLMLPFLCFDMFYRHELSFSDIYLIIYTVILTYILIAIIYVLARLLKYNTKDGSALILSSVFMNSGNYGIPVVLLAFGEEGRPIVIFLTVFHGVLQATIGIYYAAKGGGAGSVGIKAPLLAVVRMPVIHAIVLGFLFQKLGIHISENFMVCIEMVGNASIPTAMIVLGMQLATISLKHVDLLKTAIAVTLKLLISPVLAYLLVFFMPVDPLIKKVFVLTAGMPTAANTTILALQFDTDAKFVSAVTFITTLLSLVTVSALLYFMKTGLIAF